MARVKFRNGPIPIDKFEGYQVIIHIEKVNVELGEILCTVIATNDKGTIANAPGVINMEKGKDWELVSETVVEYKDPEPTPEEQIIRMLEALNQRPNTNTRRGQWI